MEPVTVKKRHENVWLTNSRLLKNLDFLKDRISTGSVSGKLNEQRCSYKRTNHYAVYAVHTIVASYNLLVNFYPFLAVFECNYLAYEGGFQV